jgi:hypothetical protein
LDGVVLVRVREFVRARGRDDLDELARPRVLPARELVLLDLVDEPLRLVDLLDLEPVRRERVLDDRVVWGIVLDSPRLSVPAAPFALAVGLTYPVGGGFERAPTGNAEPPSRFHRRREGRMPSRKSQSRSNKSGSRKTSPKSKSKSGSRNSSSKAKSNSKGGKTPESRRVERDSDTSAPRDPSKHKSNGRGSARGKRKREEFPDYSVFDPHDVPEGPDVLVDVPVVKVDKIDIEVDDLEARVALIAKVRKLLSL